MKNKAEDEKRKEWLMYIQSILQNSEAQHDFISSRENVILSVLVVLYVNVFVFTILYAIELFIIVLFLLIIIAYGFLFWTNTVRSNKLRKRIDLYRNTLKFSIKQQLSADELEKLIDIFEKGTFIKNEFVLKDLKINKKEFEKAREILHKAHPEVRFVVER